MTWSTGDTYGHLADPDWNPGFYSVESFIHLKALPKHVIYCSTSSWHVKLAEGVIRAVQRYRGKFCCFKHHSQWQSHIEESKSQHSTWEIKAACLEWKRYLISNKSSYASHSCHHWSSIRPQNLDNFTCCVKHLNRFHMCLHDLRLTGTAGLLPRHWGHWFLDIQQ